MTSVVDSVEFFAALGIEELELYCPQCNVVSPSFCQYLAGTTWEIECRVCKWVWFSNTYVHFHRYDRPEWLSCIQRAQAAVKP